MWIRCLLTVKSRVRRLWLVMAAGITTVALLAGCASASLMADSSSTAKNLCGRVIRVAAQERSLRFQVWATLERDGRFERVTPVKKHFESFRVTRQTVFKVSGISNSSTVVGIGNLPLGGTYLLRARSGTAVKIVELVPGGAKRPVSIGCPNRTSSAL